jgi:hypothetical protein
MNEQGKRWIYFKMLLVNHAFSDYISKCLSARIQIWAKIYLAKNIVIKMIILVFNLRLPTSLLPLGSEMSLLSK